MTGDYESHHVSDDHSGTFPGSTPGPEHAHSLRLAQDLLSAEQPATVASTTAEPSTMSESFDSKAFFADLQHMLAKMHSKSRN